MATVIDFGTREAARAQKPGKPVNRHDSALKAAMSRKANVLVDHLRSALFEFRDNPKSAEANIEWAIREIRRMRDDVSGWPRPGEAPPPPSPLAETVAQAHGHFNAALRLLAGASADASLRATVEGYLREPPAS